MLLTSVFVGGFCVEWILWVLWGLLRALLLFYVYNGAAGNCAVYIEDIKEIFFYNVLLVFYQCMKTSVPYCFPLFLMVK